MSWGKVDDRLHASEKALSAGLEAMGLWLMSLSSICSAGSQACSEGFLSDRRGIASAGHERVFRRLAERLRSSGLWHRADEPCPLGHADCDKLLRNEKGYRFHDWQDYQGVKGTPEERSKKASKAAKARWSGDANEHASSNAQPHARTMLEHASRARPVPVPVPEEEDPETRDKPAEPSLVNPTSGKTRRAEVVASVLDHWASQAYFERRPKETPARRKRVMARLAEGFSEEELKAAISGAARDPWLMGKDPKTNGKAYKDIETILRDAGQVERLAALAGPDVDEAAELERRSEERRAQARRELDAAAARERQERRNAAAG